ncbi:MAG: hypothetical protein ACYDGR_16370 [Candidatus Dormibacteria bacterium]
MDESVDELALLAVHAGQVLLTRAPGDSNWRLPRTIPPGQDIEAALRVLVGSHGLEVLETHDLGVRAVGSQRYRLKRLKIAGKPSVDGFELRLVRLAQLPKELASPDRELLDALLAP